MFNFSKKIIYFSFFTNNIFFFIVLVNNNNPGLIKLFLKQLSTTLLFFLIQFIGSCVMKNTGLNGQSKQKLLEVKNTPETAWM